MHLCRVYQVFYFLHTLQYLHFNFVPMRKFVYSLTLLLVTSLLTMSAQNTLTIHQKDGSKFGYGFSEKPVITYTETDLILTTNSTVVEYPLSAIAKFTFTENETSVSDIRSEIKTPTLQLDNNTVQISGAEPLQAVSLIDTDGKIISAYKTDANGSVSFSITELPKGIYIIKTKSLTCKISKL